MLYIANKIDIIRHVVNVLINEYKNNVQRKIIMILKNKSILSFFGFVLSGILFIFVISAAQADDEIRLAPDPRYSPEEVVQIQLEALQKEDIEVTFRFASPSNKSQTGPLERFARMIEGPLYSPMIGSLTIYYYPVEIREHLAFQRVKLFGKGGEEVIYVFYLSKQTASPYENCWMTDAVIAESWNQGGSSI
jgi:hypothetical protein